MDDLPHVLHLDVTYPAERWDEIRRALAGFLAATEEIRTDVLIGSTDLDPNADARRN